MWCHMAVANRRNEQPSDNSASGQPAYRASGWQAKVTRTEMAGGVPVPDVGGRETGYCRTLGEPERRSWPSGLRFWVSDALGVPICGQANGPQAVCEGISSLLDRRFRPKPQRSDPGTDCALKTLSTQPLSLICAMQGPEKPR